MKKVFALLMALVMLGSAFAEAPADMGMTYCNPPGPAERGRGDQPVGHAGNV